VKGLRRSSRGHLDAIVLLESLCSSLLVTGSEDACNSQCTSQVFEDSIHTASLANLLECLLHWSPSVLAHIFFSGHLVDCGINCVSGDLATSVLPGTEDDSKGGSVTSDGGSSADCVGLSNCVGWSIGVEDGIHLRPSIEPPARPPQNEFQASSLCLRLAEAHLVNS
jgi:hypothetical protein